MLHKNDIELFVRKTLGCTCPDEVFQHIDCRSHVNLPGGIALDYRIDIGGRLLVFVLAIDRFDSVASTLPLLVSAGIQDRDNAGFNRIRLVLLAKNPAHIRDKAFDLFNSLKTDEKTHLHIIPKNNFPIRSD